MRKGLWIWGCICVATHLFTACQPSEDEKITECAQDFAYAYFNMNFDQADACCTQESRKWLSFRASNITERDIEAHNTQSGVVQTGIDNIRWQNDSTVLACCLTENAVAADSLEEKQGHIAQRRKWWIPLVKRNGKWRVKMEAPLQSAE